MKKLVFWSVGSFRIEVEKPKIDQKISSMLKLFRVLPNVYIATDGLFTLIINSIFFIVPIVFVYIDRSKKKYVYFVIPSFLGLAFYFGTLFMFLFIIVVCIYNIFLGYYGISELFPILILWGISFFLFYFNPVLLVFYRELESSILNRVEDKLRPNNSFKPKPLRGSA